MRATEDTRSSLKGLLRFVLPVLALAVMLCACGEQMTGPQQTATPSADAKAVADALAQTGEATVAVPDELELASPIDVVGVKTLTGGMIKATTEMRTLINVTSGSTLVLDGTKLDADILADHCIVVEEGARLEIRSGKLTNSDESAVDVFGSLRMTGGEIHFPTTNWVLVHQGGEAVIEGGKFTFSGTSGLQVNANAKLTVDGAPLFNFTGGPVVFNRGAVTLNGGTYTNAGGYAISNAGEMTIGPDVTVSDTSTDGLVHNYRMGVIIIDGATLKNSASAAIYNRGGDVTLKNMTIRGMSGNGVSNSLDGIVRLSNVTFQTIAGHGIFSDNASVEAEDLTLKDIVGNGILNQKANFTGKNVTFHNIGKSGVNNTNSVLGVYEYGNVTLDTFTVDKVTNYGLCSLGGEFVAKNGTISNTKSNNLYIAAGTGMVTSVDCLGSTGEELSGVVIGGGKGPAKVTMEKCTVTGSARGLLNRGDESELTLIDCAITRNGSDEINLLGGGINNSGTLWAIGCRISDNVGLAGGGVYNFGNLTMEGGTVTGNRSMRAAGGFCNDTAESNAAIRNVTFSGNVSTTTGAGVYNAGTMTVSGCTIKENVGGASGGALYNSGKLTGSDLIMTGNKSVNYGGAVYNTGTATLRNITATGNSTTQMGGAIYNYNVMYLSDATMEGNTAETWNYELVSRRTDGEFTQLYLSGKVSAATMLAGGTSAKVTLTGIVTNESPIAVSISTVDTSSYYFHGKQVLYGDPDVLSASAGAFVLNETTGQRFAFASDGKLVGITDEAQNTVEESGVVHLKGPDGNVKSTGTLSAMVAEASPGDTLVIASDLTQPAIVIISKSLNIIDDGAVRVIRSPSTHLNPIVIQGNSDEKNIRVNITTTDTGGLVFDGTSPDGQSVVMQRAFIAALYADVKMEGNIVFRNINNQGVQAEGALNGTNNHGGGLRVSTTGNVDLVGVTFENCYASTYGGAVYNAGKLTLESVTAKNCSSGKEGGAIFNVNGGEVTLRNGTLTGNQAGASGGAIYNAGTMDIIDSTITGNSTKASGGAIFGNAKGVMTITGSTITGNSAVGYGGGIYNSNLLKVDNCTIVDNLTNRTGHNIYTAKTGLAEIANSDVGAGIVNAGIGTSTSPSASKPNGSGTAQLWKDYGTPEQRFRSAGTLFDMAKKADEGDTVVITSDAYLGPTAWKMFQGCSFTITDDGNGPYTITSGAPNEYMMTFQGLNGSYTNPDGSVKTVLTIKGTSTGSIIFDGEDVERSKGAVNLFYGGMHLENVVFRNFRSSASGGAVYVQRTAAATMKNVTIENCTVARSGAGVFVQGQLTAEDCTFANNTATNYGGGIYAEHNEVSFGTYTGVTLINCTVRNNVVDTMYGAGICTTARLTVTGGSITDNRVLSNNAAGGVYVGSQPASFTNVTLTGNSANTSGAAIFCNGPLTLDHVTVTGNNAPRNGGVYANGEITVISSTIKDNNQEASLTKNDLRLLGASGQLILKGADNDFGTIESQNDAALTIDPTFALKDGTSVILKRTTYNVGDAALTGDAEAVTALSARTVLDTTGRVLKADGTIGRVFAVTLSSGVTGAASTDGKTDYTFSIDGYDTTKFIYTVTVKVGGAVISVTDNGDGSYTIPHASITDDISVTVKKTSMSGPTFEDSEGTTLEPGQPGYNDVEAYVDVDEGNVTNYGTLDQVVAAASSGDTVIVRRNVSLSTQLVVDKNLNVAGNGTNWTVSVSYAASGNHPIDIQGADESSKITVNISDLTFDGGDISRDKALFRIKYATLNLSGVVVQNTLNTATGVANGGAACRIETDSLVNLTDGTLIQDNKGRFGPAFCINGGKLMVYDAAIGAEGHGNEATSNAAIYLVYGTVELFDGASVSYNTSASSGGAFYNTGIVRVHSGAEITHNTVTGAKKFGAAAWVDSLGQFTVSSGAVVSDNRSQGGGAFYMTGGTLNVAGTVQNNTCTTASGGAVILNQSSGKTVTVNIQNGAVIKGNTSTVLDGSDISVLSGTLNVNGTVNVGSIALNEGQTITPSGAVTLAPGADRITVKPASYAVGTLILSGDNAALAYQAFRLENDGWYIDSDGRITSADREALAQIAYAFYDKDQAGYVHYDMSGMAKAGHRLAGSPWPVSSRRQLYVSPEYATYGREVYMDCSGFVWNVYYQAYGDAFKAVIPESIATSGGIGTAYDTYDYLVYSWGTTDGSVTMDEDAKNEVIAWLDSNLQVGDLISLYRADGATGHVVMYIGDGKVIDMRGYSYKYHDTDDDTAMGEEDNAKADEGIRISTAAERITVGKDVGVRVVRPLGKLTSAALTENAQARAALGRLAVSKTVLPVGNAVASGGTLTYAITLHNTGSVPVTVDVADTAPFGTTVTDTLVWNDITVAPSATRTLSYDARVIAADGQIIAGRCVVSRDGSTADLEVPCNSVYVGATLAAPSIAALEAALETPPTGDAVTYLKELYWNAVSRAIPMTSDDELFDAVFEDHVAAASSGFYLVRESVAGDLGECLVANFQAGHMVANRDTDELHGRIRYLAKENLMPGDVVAVDLKNDAGYAYYVWLGDSMKVITNDAVTDGNADLLLEQLLGHDRFMVLRFSGLPASVPVTLNDGITGDTTALTGSDYEFSFTGDAGTWYAVIADVDGGATTRTLYYGAGPHTGTVTVPKSAMGLSIGMTQMADAEAVIGTTFYSTLVEAMSDADESGVPTTVEVLSDCEITADAEYSNANGITVRPFGADRTITLGATARITVSGNVTYVGSDSAGLTITGLDEARTVSGAFAVTGTLTFGENVTVTGMNNQFAAHESNTNNGAVANVRAGGTVQIDGASITGNNDKSFGAAFFVKGGIVNMTAGEISNNTAGNHGGALYLMSTGAVFTMTGGEIKNNSSTANGGAIYAASDTSVTLSGGTVSGNTAVKGGAVYIEAASGKTVVLTIGAAAITDNTATTADISGGVHAGANSTLRIQDGATITGNKAGTYDRDVYTPSTVVVNLEGELNVGYIYRYVTTIGKVTLTGTVTLKDGSDPIIVVSKAPAVGLVALDGDADIIAESYTAFAIDSDAYVIGADGKLAEVADMDMMMPLDPAGSDVDGTTGPTGPDDPDALPPETKDDESEDERGDGDDSEDNEDDGASSKDDEGEGSGSGVDAKKEGDDDGAAELES